jgi:hypothetical protein
MVKLTVEDKEALAFILEGEGLLPLKKLLGMALSNFEKEVLSIPSSEERSLSIAKAKYEGAKHLISQFNQALESIKGKKA